MTLSNATGWSERTLSHASISPDMDFQSSTNEPADWASHLAPEEAFASAPWLRLFGDRVSRERYWFAARSKISGELLAGIAGHVQREPGNYPMLNEHLIIPGKSPFWPKEAEVPEDGGTPIEFPALWLVYPGLASFLVGQKSQASSSVRFLLTMVLDWARASRCKTVVVPYVGAPRGALSVALGELGFGETTIAQDAWLAVGAGGWNQYIGSFPSRRRRNINRERRQLAAHNVVVREAGEDRLDPYVDLLAKQQRKYGRQEDRSNLQRRMFDLTQLAPTCIIVAEHGSDPEPRPISFCLFSKLGSDLHAMMTGTDYGNENSRLAYFEVTFYSAVEAAARMNVKRIGYGLASSAAKRNRGAELTAVSCWVRSLDYAGRTPHEPRNWLLQPPVDSDEAKNE